MNTLFKSMIGGFGRVFGRFIFYIVIGVAIYFLIKYFGVDLSNAIRNIRRIMIYAV